MQAVRSPTLERLEAGKYKKGDEEWKNGVERNIVT
jgi:hypothetical protein